MLNLFKLPTDFDKREVEEAAEYAFDICFKDWSTVDFEQLYDLLKSKIGIDKYLELERDIYRPFWQSFYVLPVKERKKLNSSQKYPQRLVRAYSYWRWVTAALVVQNRLLELETVRTASAQKVVDISLNFLSDISRIYAHSPVWCDKMPLPSPFLAEDGEEIHHMYDLS